MTRLPPRLTRTYTRFPYWTLFLSLRTSGGACGRSGDACVAAGGLPEGAVAMRTIGEGELVPAEAVGAAADTRVTTVVIDTAVDVPATIDAGTRVEVWFAPAVERGVFDTPRILVADATVASVTRDEEIGRAHV